MKYELLNAENVLYDCHLLNGGVSRSYSVMNQLRCNHIIFKPEVWKLQDNYCMGARGGGGLDGSLTDSHRMKNLKVI